MEDSPSDTDVSAIQSHAFLFDQNVAKKNSGEKGSSKMQCLNGWLTLNRVLVNRVGINKTCETN